MDDYSLGSLLRLDASCDYTEENSIIAIKIQEYFYKQITFFLIGTASVQELV